MSDGGKGSSPRPFGVTLEQFDENWERIFKGKPKKEEPIESLVIQIQALEQRYLDLRKKYEELINHYEELKTHYEEVSSRFGDLTESSNDSFGMY